MSRSEVAAAFDRTRELLGPGPGGAFLSASCRPSNLLVPQAAARARCGRHRTSPARSAPSACTSAPARRIRGSPAVSASRSDRGRVFRDSEGVRMSADARLASTDRRGDRVRAGLRAGPLCAVCAACHRRPRNSRRPARPRRRLWHGHRGAPRRGGGGGPRIGRRARSQSRHDCGRATTGARHRLSRRPRGSAAVR